MIYTKGILDKTENENIFTAVASSEIVDRDGEIVKISGIDISAAKNYLPILLQHDYRQFPIGKAIEIKKEKNELIITFELDIDDTQTEYIASKIRNKFLRAVSIGIKPISRKKDKNNNIIIEKSELLELSIVTIPSNKLALIKNYLNTKKGQIMENTTKTGAVLSSSNRKKLITAAENILAVVGMEMPKATNDTENEKDFREILTKMNELETQNETLTEKIQNIENLFNNLIYMENNDNETDE